MQGKKVYQEKLFNDFRLSDRVPGTNFYRRLKEVLHLDFLYQETRSYYGHSGQKSIDPVVFFKLCLVGYLENIISDRKLLEHASMRLDVLYFLGYDVVEEYERNNQRLSTEKGKRMKSKRQATVEPVFGTLTQFMGLRKINTIGIKQANKVMHLSAIAYNLKKYLKFIDKKVKSGAATLNLSKCIKTTFYDLFGFEINLSKITIPYQIL